MTGLVVVDTADHWSAFGQLVILLMIQAGGFGFMAGSTLLLLVVARRDGLSDRIVVQESTGARHSVGVERVRRVALFTLVAEGVGVFALGSPRARSARRRREGVW